MAREPREVLVKDLLQDKWDDSNTFSLTPAINFGWFDEKPDTRPAVMPQPQQEGPELGGRTRYAGIDSGGGTPHQEYSGIVPVHCWCGKDDLGSANTNNQREYLSYAIEEVARIIRNNAIEPTNPSTNNQPVRVIAPGGSNPVPEPDKRGMYHHMINVAYVYGTG